MSAHDDRSRYEEEEAMERFIEEQLRQMSESPVIYYLARYGDAIEERVRRRRCRARRTQISFLSAVHPQSPTELGSA